MSLSNPKRKELLGQFGQLIHLKRKALGMSQEDLSSLAGYKMNMANYWEKGNKLKLNNREFNKICSCLKLSEDEIEPYLQLISGKGVRAEYVATKDPVIQKSLRILFERVGVSQTEFARELGIVPSHVAAWLTGRAEPKIGHLKKIVSLYFAPIMQAEAMEFLVYGTSFPERSYKQQAEMWKSKYNESIKQSSAQQL